MLKKTLFNPFAIGFIVLITINSCRNKQTFTVEGQITGADSSVIYFAKRGFTDTNIIDSVRLDKSGKFRFTEKRSEYPDFYLLQLNKQMINLAIDSTETIKIKAAKKDFETNYQVEGSENSSRIKENVLAVYKLTKDINNLKTQHASKVVSDAEYITQLKQLYTTYKLQAQKLMFVDLKSLSAYFILFQQVDGTLIYDPYDKSDSRMFRAVATSWDVYNKSMPRAKQLHDFVINAIRTNSKNLAQNTLINAASQASPSDYYKIELPNIKGQNTTLLSSKGKVTILDFTAYQTDFSPQHNSLLNQIYVKNKGQLNIYQVSFDSDLHFWQNAASNLPWKCVRDDQSVNSELIKRFNIQSFPTMYLLDKNGEIVKRLSADENIQAEIQKLL